ncbi:tRNA (adenosine(37)-N6)-threonylcarbamoyltransferase complex transferase subunit TsaD [Patescibacteria group bacterium]|nr:tRNA (adenosine(37)-N6)-threonylcarbamoyltransferase complex transferase subunit TsaD [Patescibacteria group bacterium]
MYILAIETSCDETSAAVIYESDNRPIILSNVVSSQIDLHKKYGGVVPEVAARAHIEIIIPVIDEAIKKADISLDEIDYIAPTYGPGLIGSLLVGVETAKALALARNIPIIPINHLEGHLYANFVSENKKNRAPGLKPENKQLHFPILALIISGGHTMLIIVKDHLKYQVVGRTRDDAAGEAFDKAAKILGLGYPGGPIISKWAEEGDESSYKFPTIDLTDKPFRDQDGYLRHPEASLDFSFSGLKTSLLTKVKEITVNNKVLNDKEISNLAASFQKAIVDNVSQNVLRGVERYQPKTFIISGGVAANKQLRETLKKNIEINSPEVRFLVPEFELCTDNAAMIGIAGYYQIKNLNSKFEKNIVAVPSLKLEESV